MNKKISVGLAVAIAAIIATIAVTFTYTFAMNTFNERMNSVMQRQYMYDELSELDAQARLSLLYEIDEEMLNESIMNGYVEGLGDEYAEYLNAQEYQLYLMRAAGSDYGLGMEIAKNSDGNIVVTRVNSGSPADSKGVEKGDVITSVNGSKVLEIGYDAAVAQLSSGTAKVTFIALRNKKEYKFTIQKDTYTISSVEYKMLTEETGYIRITEFNEQTITQFNSAINSLKSQSVTGIIIDVRDNSGGSYEVACKMLDTILPAGRLMIGVNARGEEETLYSSDNKEYRVAFAVLINENTMGAAELFAAAIADYNRGDLIGTTTYGLTSVQEVFALSGGSAVKLTTCGWKSTSSSCLSEDGKILPEYEVKLTDYQYENRYFLTDAEDPQLQTAMDSVALRYSSMDTYDYIFASETDLSDTDISDGNVTATDA